MALSAQRYFINGPHYVIKVFTLNEAAEHKMTKKKKNTQHLTGQN